MYIYIHTGDLHLHDFSGSWTQSISFASRAVKVFHQAAASPLIPGAIRPIWSSTRGIRSDPPRQVDL